MTLELRFAEGRLTAMAIGSALALLLVSGGAYRLAQRHLNNVTSGVPVPPGTLQALPLAIGGWQGVEVPLDRRVVEATDTDDHLHRRYSRGAGSVMIWIACGVRLRDLMPHRPEVCYVGSGWLLEAERQVVLQTAGGEPLTCRVQQFRRGGLQGEQITVLSYFVVSGVYSPDVELLRRRAWRMADQPLYAAQVQVSCANPLRDRAEELVREFAAESAPTIRELLTAATVDGG